MSDVLAIEVLGEDGSFDLPSRGTLVIGSSPGRADQVLEGQGVEDAHCAIGKLQGGGWAVKDLGSEYGTLVNGAPIQTTRLVVGDVIVLGSRRLRVVDPSAAGETQAQERPDSEDVVDSGRAPHPERIGGYRIERLLGRGGMGQVFLAVQESLNRPVALKILSPERAADREFVLRFQSEARAAAALAHPNVVVVHDVGEAGGHHFLSMEYMPGGSLEERVTKTGPLPWRQVLDVLVDAASGLTYAESRGIVHRDIKPANLMQSGTGAVKIADLGLAIAIEEQRSDLEGGKVYATPHFVSPEQARGAAVDHRADLYSLGATIYRLLSGHTPFHGATTRAILRARFQEDPRPLGEIVPGLPPGLAALVQRLMEREPGKRPSSAEELRREAERLRIAADHGEPAPPIEEPPRSRARLWLGFAAALAILSGAAWVLMQMRTAEPGESTTSSLAAGPGAATDDRSDDADFFGVPEAPGNDEDADEQTLRIQELEAGIAYRDLPAEQEPGARVMALGELIERFPATRIASQARSEIDTLNTHMNQSRLSEARLQRDVQLAINALRTAAGWLPTGDHLPDAGRGLRAAAGFRPPAAVAVDPRFKAARNDLVTEILSDTTAAVEAARARADELGTAGRFAELSDLLGQILAALDLPAESADDSEALTRLRLTSAAIRTRRANLEQEERGHARLLAEHERRVVGLALGPASGFSAELAALDLERASGRLRALLDDLHTDPTRTTVTALSTELALAAEALDMLAREFNAGRWRRTTVAVPDGRRMTAREAVGVNDSGILFGTQGGAELVPWSAFAGGAKDLVQIFKGRLEREYTAAEQRGIVALLRLAAVSEVVRAARPALAPGAPRTDVLAGAELLAGAFAPVNEWVEEVASQELGARITHEREAGALLLASLAAFASESWTPAVAGLERLMTSYADTFFVLLLADGTALAPGEVANVDPANTPDEAEPDVSEAGTLDPGDPGTRRGDGG